MRRRASSGLRRRRSAHREDRRDERVDRLHTALDGYLRQAAAAANITCRSSDPSITALWSQLRAEHPRLQYTDPRPKDIETIQRGFATIANALNPIRNMASLAHPQ